MEQQSSALTPKVNVTMPVQLIALDLTQAAVGHNFMFLLAALYGLVRLYWCLLSSIVRNRYDRAGIPSDCQRTTDPLRLYFSAAA
jgi:hypothetical protein